MTKSKPRAKIIDLGEIIIKIGPRYCKFKSLEQKIPAGLSVLFPQFRNFMLWIPTMVWCNANGETYTEENSPWTNISEVDLFEGTDYKGANP